MYLGTWARRDRWATLRSVFQAVWAFKAAYRDRQDARPSTSSFEDDDSDGAMSYEGGPLPSSSNIPSSHGGRHNQPYGVGSIDIRGQ